MNSFIEPNKPAAQTCAVDKSRKFWRATGQSTWHTNAGRNKSFGFRTHTNAFWRSLPFCLQSLI